MKLSLGNILELLWVRKKIAKRRSIGGVGPKYWRVRWKGKKHKCAGWATEEEMAVGILSRGPVVVFARALSRVFINRSRYSSLCSLGAAIFRYYQTFLPVINNNPIRHRTTAALSAPDWRAISRLANQPPAQIRLD